MPQGLDEGKCSYRGRSHSSRVDYSEKSAEAIVPAWRKWSPKANWKADGTVRTAREGL